MISKKQREEMLEEAAKAMCENNGETFQGYIAEAFVQDAQSCLKVFEPFLLAEVQAEFNRLSSEMDRLVDENEYLTSRVDDLEAGY